MLVSNDNEYIYLAGKNSVRINRAKELGPIDTLTFSGLNGNIENMTFSADYNKIYFKSGNDILRFNLAHKQSRLKAFFYFDKNNTYARDKISFYNASAGYPGSSLWDFGDGTTSTDKNPVHTYNDTGYFDVKLTIFKDNEKDSMIVKDAVYIQPYMKSDFEFTKYDSECPVRVQFSIKSQGDIDSVNWDFGDGSRSNEIDPVHFYNFNEIYKVNLRIFSKKLSMDTTKSIEISIPYIPIDNSLYKFEYTFQRDSVSEALQGFELTNGAIVFNELSGKTSGIISSEDNVVVWEKYQSKGNPGILAQSLTTHNLILGQGSTLSLINENGELLKNLGLQNKKANSHDRNITNLDVDRDEIIVGSYCDYNFYDPIKDFYTTQLDKNINIINDTLFTSIEIPHEVSTDVYIFNYYISKHWGLNDYVFRYRHEYYTNEGHPSYAVLVIDSKLIINDKLFSRYDNLDFNDVVRLNPEKLIIAFNDHGLSAFNNSSSFVWGKNLGTGAIYKKMLRLSDTAFAAVGSINGQPGYVIYNESGDILDSASIPCRYGCFNHVSVTPDTNLLLSGYILTDRAGDRNAYFVKTASGKIKSYLLSLFKGGDDSSVIDTTKPVKQIRFSPNPTTGEIIIQESALVHGQLRIDLMDVYGGLVSNLFDGNFDGGQLRYDISGIADGMYFLRINNNGNMKMSKVAKVR
jgi:PKD repeat protein